MFPLSVYEASGGLWQTILHSNLLNVVLALIILVAIARKLNIGQALTAQQTRLATSVQQMELQKQQTQQALQNLKQRSEVLHREIDHILSEARQSADAIAKKIIAQAEQEALRINQHAVAQQAQMLSQANATIQQQFMQDVLNDTEQRLQSRVGQVNPHDAIDQFIHALPMVAGQIK